MIFEIEGQNDDKKDWHNCICVLNVFLVGILTCTMQDLTEV